MPRCFWLFYAALGHDGTLCIDLNGPVRTAFFFGDVRALFYFPFERLIRFSQEIAIDGKWVQSTTREEKGLLVEDTLCLSSVITICQLK